MLSFVILSLASVLASAGQGRPSSLSAAVDQVNPLIGTAGEGQTYPSAGVPFGMTQWAPQTRDGEQKCIAPYYFADTRIQGFRGSHFLTGSCTQDYGSVTLMPMTGPLKLGQAQRSSAFTHSQEQSSPYRYAVTLTDYKIRAAVTGTSHAGLLRFTFASPGLAWILVESNSRVGEGAVTINAQRGEVTGFNPVHRLYAGSGKSAGFNGYFVVRFDHKFRLGGTWTGNTRHEGSEEQAGVEGTPGAYVSFELKTGESVQAKVGTSFTSLDEARRNLDAEIPGWDFQQVEDKARADWSAALEKIQITEPDAAKRSVFYTALYHSMLLPREFSDVGGSHPGFANEGKTEYARNFKYYCDFSLWDTFRSVHPLLTIIDPAREQDMVQSLIAKGEQGGFLPIYPAWNSYTSEMIGDHASTVIVDAYFKGIRGFDVDAAYKLMRKNATEMPGSLAEYVDGKGRRGLESYLKYGYIPLEDRVPNSFHHDEQVSRTLENAYDDFVVGKLAHALGHEDDAALFAKRAQNYRNVIDPGTGFARGRHTDGTWVSPFDPTKAQSYITEGLPYQYTFFVPQDVEGLISLVGGRKAFIEKLDGLFTGGYYDHGNEPSHHIAYLYDYAGAAWKTQMRVRNVMETKYFDRPDGLAGNDDCGQMSAWYVLSALGFYPVTPGEIAYQIGTPLFDQATILLPGGKRFHIVATGASQGKQYIRSAKLNHETLSRAWITHQEIVAGGELEFEMSSEPNPDWPPQAH